MRTVSSSVVFAFFTGPGPSRRAEALGTGLGLVASLLIALVVGAVIGRVASRIVKGSGSGPRVDILVGIGGSLLGSCPFPATGPSFGSGLIGAFLPALIGAVILLLVIRFMRKA